MRRLYHQFYLTIVASLLLVVLAAGALWRFAPNETPAEQAFEMAGELVAAHLAPGRRRTGRPAAGDRAAARSASASISALFDGDRAAASRRPAARCRLRRATRDERRLDLRPRRAGLGHPPARRPLARRPRAAAPAPSRARHHRLPRRHRARGGGLRLSAGAPADAPAGAAAGGRRVAGRGRSVGARQGRRQGRGGAAGGELQPRRRAHRGAGRARTRCCSPTPRTSCARRWRASASASSCCKDSADPSAQAELEKDIAELDGLIEQILLSSRLDAVKAARRARGGRPAGARRGGRRPLRAVLRRRRAGHRARRSRPAAAHGAQSARQRASGTARRRSKSRSGRAGHRPSVTVADHGPGRRASRARAHLLAVLPRAGSADAAGTGLGLALVRQIARQHGGEAAWAGSHDQPSAIRVTLPACPQTSA